MTEEVLFVYMRREQQCLRCGARTRLRPMCLRLDSRTYHVSWVCWFSIRLLEVFPQLFLGFPKTNISLDLVQFYLQSPQLVGLGYICPGLQ